MPARHRRPIGCRPRLPAARRRRARVLVVVLAPLVVVVPLTAMAASDGWSRTWNPPLALLSSYSSSARSTAGFASFPYSVVAGPQERLTVTAAVKTRWVDTKARVDSPNILQEGLYDSPAQVKLQVQHGSTPASHRAQCRVKGAGGVVLATGPAIDIADGDWHTVTCTKSADGDTRTAVVVTVDGVDGPVTYSSSAIGRVAPPGKLDLGGRSAVASTDSLDGWLRSVRIDVG
jgi:hypothetical protein